MEEQPIIIDQVDATKRLFSNRALIAIATLFVLAILPWFLLKDLLSVPKEVEESRKHFVTVVERYQQESSFWIAKKNQLFSEIAQERLTADLFGNTARTFSKIQECTLLAYLVDDLGLDLLSTNPSTNDWAITYNPEKEHFIISKIQQSLFCQQVLSMVVALEKTNKGYKPNIVLCRKGSRRIQKERATQHFQTLIAHLHPLLQLQAETEQLEFIAEKDTWQLHWQWLPRPSTL